MPFLPTDKTRDAALLIRAEKVLFGVIANPPRTDTKA
jgi:hypothetical protein